MGLLLARYEQPLLYVWWEPSAYDVEVAHVVACRMPSQAVRAVKAAAGASSMCKAPGALRGQAVQCSAACTVQVQVR
jgi:hypothetical protein